MVVVEHHVVFPTSSADAWGLILLYPEGAYNPSFKVSRGVVLSSSARELCTLMYCGAEYNSTDMCGLRT